MHHGSPATFTYPKNRQRTSTHFQICMLQACRLVRVSVYARKHAARLSSIVRVCPSFSSRVIALGVLAAPRTSGSFTLRPSQRSLEAHACACVRVCHVWHACAQSGPPCAPDGCRCLMWPCRKCVSPSAQDASYQYRHPHPLTIPCLNEWLRAVSAARITTVVCSTTTPFIYCLVMRALS